MIYEKQLPPAYASMNERLDFVYLSGNTFQPNFKYVFEVFIGGVKQATVKIFPDPGTQLGVFNAARIIRSYVDNTRFYNQDLFLQPVPPEGFQQVSYEIRVGEEYGSPVIAYTNLLSSGIQTAYNYYADPFRPMLSRTPIVDYIGKFLSDRPRVQKVTLNNEPAFLPIFNPEGVDLDIGVRVYDASGALVNGIFTNGNDKLFQVGYAPSTINAFAIAQGASAIIDSTTAFYDVHVGTDVFTFKMDCFSKWKNWSVVFLNKYGVYESADFRMKSTRSLDVERKSFGPKDYQTWRAGVFTLDADPGGVYYANDYTATTFRPTEQIYSSKHRQKIKLTTDYLSDEEFEWLYQLVVSKSIFLRVFYNGWFMIPVKVAQNNYEFKTRQGHGMQPLEIDLELLQNINQ